MKPFTTNAHQAAAFARLPVGGKMIFIVPMKVQPDYDHDTEQYWFYSEGEPNECVNDIVTKAPHQPGEKLWLREAWVTSYWVLTHGPESVLKHKAGYAGGVSIKWHSPITMPRWAARSFAAVQSVQAARVGDIAGEVTGVDYETTGIRPISCESCNFPDCSYCDQVDFGEDFKNYWHKHHNRRYPWDSNPWCWLIEVEKTNEHM